jgi:outer membrane lipoprotein-sorting protein
MSDSRRRESDDEVIRRAARSCKPAVTASPGSKERVFAQLTAHLEARRSAPALKIGRRRHAALFLAVGSATAALAVVCLTLWLTVGGGVSPVKGDFAEVLRRIRSIRSVAHHLTFLTPGQPDVEGDILASPGHLRVTWRDGKVDVISEIQKKTLTLRPALRQASLVATPDSGSYTDLLQSLRNASDSAGAYAGRATVDGREADVYTVSLPEGGMRMWVDPASELPSRVELTPRGADSNEAIVVMSSFRWDVPIDESLFLLDIPVGYTLRRLDAEPTEADLVRLLRICEDRANGRFPAKLDVDAVSGLVQGQSGGVVRGIGGGQGAMNYTRTQDEYRELLRDCLGGLAFVQRIREKGTWKYVGADVRFGDGNTEVCWWTSPGSTTRKVVFGDLRITDAPLGNSPSEVSPDSSQPASTNRTE